MPTRIPTEADFAPILPSHPTYRVGQPSPITLVYPNPPESTTAILLLFHGLGDTPAPFTTFARSLSLPGVLSISVQGVSPLPAFLLPPTPSSSSSPAAGGGGGVGYHWGDDLTFLSSSGDLDPDPGFAKATRWVMDKLVGEVLVERCGWGWGDVMVFGFGQGGGLALGLASLLRTTASPPSFSSSSSAGGAAATMGGKAFKGVVSVGAGLPASMVPSRSGLGKAETPVLVLCGRESEAVDEDAVEVLEREFKTVRVVRWARADDGMPRSREEVLPMMQFFAERLRSGW